MKVGHVTERSDASVAPSFLESEEQEHAGADLGGTGRLQLMTRHSEGETFSQTPGFPVTCVFTCGTCKQGRAFRWLLQLSRLCI